jgi:hypothetical protein
VDSSHQDVTLAKKEGTGIYFNNQEVESDLHPFQVRQHGRYSTTVPGLLCGKPMPLPPQLKAVVPPTFNNVTRKRQVVEETHKYANEAMSRQETLPPPLPLKRARLNH